MEKNKEVEELEKKILNVVHADGWRADVLANYLMEEEYSRQKSLSLKNISIDDIEEILLKDWPISRRKLAHLIYSKIYGE